MRTRRAALLGGESSLSGPLQLACELVAAATPNPPGDERAAADVVVRHLRTLGIEDVRVVGPSPSRPNVIARIPGTRGGRSLILGGHLDTKPPGDLGSWNTPPFEPVLENGNLYGLGAADMKGAVAAMVHAAGRVARAGLEGDLILVFTADEEAGGANGAAWLASQGLLVADAAVLGEPSGISREWEAIRLVSRGAAIVEVTIAGTAMHSSLSDQLPSVNANVVMARLIDRFAKDLIAHLTYPAHPTLPLVPTVNPALLVQGGTALGMLPESASFVSDLRLVPGMTPTSVADDITKFMGAVTAENPNLAATFTVGNWLDPCEIDGAHPIVSALASASDEVLGFVPPLGIFPGGTDAPAFQLTAGIPTVPSFGPGLLVNAHRPNESISIVAIDQATTIYESVAKAFLNFC